MKALIVLTPTESKRLIAKGVAALPEVTNALKQGTIIVGWGSTNTYVAQEISGETVETERFLAGYIGGGELKVSEGQDRIPPVVLHKGKRVDVHPKDALQTYSRDDVFIKGANAVDPDGNAGILLHNDVGGTIGTAIGILAARGSHLIIPVGLEKLIPSVKEASNTCGLETVDYATGKKVGFMPVMYGRTVNEINALQLLADVNVVHIASGGLDDSQGAITLAVSGDGHNVGKVIEIVEDIKNA
ncbi:MAG: hypothetical protein JSV84_09530 [Gemmatimonadota bacterium]|nr:MAG: hypothetical protein JSV84_09530 [Gemmatimonadota bacterium]